MNEPYGESELDQFAAILTAYDDALTKGASSVGSVREWSHLPTALRGRLEKAAECLQLLNQHWPRPTRCGISTSRMDGQH